MPLPPRADETPRQGGGNDARPGGGRPRTHSILRTSITVVWTALALGTLSWKAPGFWIPASHPAAPAAPSAAASSPPAAIDPARAGESTPAGAPDYASPPERPSTEAPSHHAVSSAAASTAASAMEHAPTAANPSGTERLLAGAAESEAAGRFAEAIEAYRQIESTEGSLNPPVQLRLARALQWSGAHDAAAQAYDHYFAMPAADRSPALLGEFGAALVDAGRDAEALPYLDAGLAHAQDDPALLVASARAATTLRQPARAAAALVRLSTVRTLTTDEALWLTGQLEAAGDAASGLPALYAALDASGAPSLWERIGDLEWTRGRYGEAENAYRHVPQECSSGVPLKTARAAARAAHVDQASASYERAVDCSPRDPVVLLEAARFHGGRGAPDHALPYYDQYAAAARPTRGEWLEMTQTALAGERPDLALAWADAGARAGAESPELTLARAQALHLLNRPAEAERALARLAVADPDNGVVLVWQGRTAYAQGRHLTAFRLFDRALSTNVDGRADLLVARGDAAAARGDVERAHASYVSARAFAASPESDIDGRLEAIARRTAPEVTVPFELLDDSNGITLRQAGAGLGLWPARAARVRVGWTAGTIAQGAYRFDRRAFSVRLDQFLPAPAIRVDASAGIEDYGAATLPVWNAGAQLDLGNGGFVAVRTMRETPWSAETTLDAQRYNRIADLSAVGPAFHATGLSGLTEVPLSRRASLRLDGGWRQYSDGNDQTALFVQLQHQLTSRGDGSLWVALQPQVYLERWSERRVAYYSPDFHLGTGVGLRAQMQRGAWHLDGNAIPQLVRAEGGQGFGLFGSAGLTRLFGRVSVGGAATIFDDRRGDYRLRRVTAEVRIPIGR